MIQKQDVTDEAGACFPGGATELRAGREFVGRACFIILSEVSKISVRLTSNIFPLIFLRPQAFIVQLSAIYF